MHSARESMNLVRWRASDLPIENEIPFALPEEIKVSAKETCQGGLSAECIGVPESDVPRIRNCLVIIDLLEFRRQLCVCAG